GLRDNRGCRGRYRVACLQAFRMLAAVEFADQASLAANEVDIVSIDRLLANEFKAAELPTANACPQRKFCRREYAPQRSCPLGAFLILTPQRLEAFCLRSAPLTRALSPLAGRGEAALRPPRGSSRP